MASTRARWPPTSGPAPSRRRWGNTSRCCARISIACRSDGATRRRYSMSQRTVQLTRVAAGVTRVVAVVGVLSVVAGCAASSKQRAARAQLERAQAAYQLAQGDPNVQSYAQLRLADAQKTLRTAEEAKDSDDKLHLSYLAERRAQLATVTGATGKTQQSMEQLRRETSDVLLQKRDRELKAARTEMETKAREAEQWRRVAEARARDVESKPAPVAKADDAEAK